MTVDKEEWIKAARNDEYAEFVLDTGDIIVTDWEGDGDFFPYVMPVGSDEDSHEAEAQIKQAIKDGLGFNPRNVEWGGNGTYVVHSVLP
mgnify:CR=1 FL=1